MLTLFLLFFSNPSLIKHVLARDKRKKKTLELMLGT